MRDTIDRMPYPYRSELDALHAQCESLRRRLGDAEKDSRKQRHVRAELESELKTLERARLSRAEHAEAARRVGRRWLLFGTLAGVTACAVVILFTQRFASSSGCSRYRQTPRAWFEQVRPHCNPVEIGVSVSREPPPPGFQGKAYLAACYGLAGKTDRASGVIDSLPKEARRRAAGTVFRVAHPVADAGDERAAGPIMELVLSYAPDHYMALYHAGMSAHERGEAKRARARLSRFLEVYSRNDGWRRRAVTVLGEY